MPLIRIAGGTLNQTPLDWEGNTGRILSLMNKAADQAAQILCLPELSLSSYGLEDLFLYQPILKQSLKSLKKLAAQAPSGLFCTVGLPLVYQGQIYNVVAIIYQNRIVGFNAKKRLARSGVHYEARWFSPWPEGQVVPFQLDECDIPFGDLSYRLGPVHIALEICEEAWHPLGGAQSHAQRGVDLVLNPSASHFAFGKAETRRTLVIEKSRALNTHYLYTNLTGLESGRTIYDGDILVSAFGELRVSSPRLQFSDTALIIYDLPLQIKTKDIYTRGQSSQPLLLNAGRVEVRLDLHKKALAGPPLLSPAIKLKHDHQENEFLRVMALGLWDYLRKSKQQGFTLSLSGGADSACLAVLCAQMTELVHRERSDLMPDPKAWRQQHLQMIYQKSAHSSAKTLNAAEALAQELGADFIVSDISELVDIYEMQAEKALGRPLSWEKDDIAKQNIQARSRAPFAWLIANLRQSLLLCTANRSESAVGYSTMDGDLAGSLAPLAGVSKDFIRSWLRWAAKEMNEGLGPIKSLDAINILEPTAELRPEEQQQTDEADLMPYHILRRLEELYIREALGLRDLHEVLKIEFPDYEAQSLKNYCERFYKLFHQSQWKRERTPPSFYLEDPSLDPKSALRFPILTQI